MEMNFDFTGSKIAESREFTLPGTIGIFISTKIEFGESKEKKTPYMRIHWQAEKVKKDGQLVPETSSFSEDYFLTQNALDRINYIHDKIHGGTMSGSISTEQLTAKFLNKRLALKVGGQISSNGKGFTRLGYSGYAEKPEDIEKLKWSTREENENKAVVDAINSGGIGQADREQPRSGQTPGPSTTNAARNSGGF